MVRGVYIDAAEWEALDAHERYLLRVRGVAETRRSPPVLSHWSAAAIHGLPALGGWPAQVHITQSPLSGARSRGTIARHSLRLLPSERERKDGMWVTTVARTVVDVASIADLRSAVVLADAALAVPRYGGRAPLTTADELTACWEARMPFAAHARARSAIEFATPLADTPLESVSRVVMREIGCPAPVLQLEHRDRYGLIGFTDFGWPEFGVVGEADGAGKYLDAAHRGGRSAEQVVYDEKLREDRLRALGLTVVRWPWSIATDPAALAARLHAAGIPVSPRFAP